MQMLSPGERTDQEKSRALSILFILLSIMLLLAVFMIEPIQKLYHEGAAVGLSSIAFILGFLGCIWAAYKMALPLRCYGLTKPTIKAIAESIVFSLLFCVVVIVIKVVLIKYVVAFQGDSLIQILAPGAPVKSLLLMLLLYSAVCPIQAMIFHGFIEGPMIDLLDVRARAFITIGLSSWVFVGVHLFIGLYLAILVIIPIVYWCMLYYRHRCVWTIAMSHILIGGILLLVVGMTPFMGLIQQVV